MSDPLGISIAIPVYNGAEYLRQALESVAAQTDQNFELVVSDNCSTDATPQILAEYAAAHPGVVVSRSPTFLPQADNVNRVVSLCSRPWVKLLCHDDLLEPDCVAVLREALQKTDTTGVGVIGHDEQWLLMNGNTAAAPRNDPPLAKWKGSDYLRSHLAGGSEPGLPSLTTALMNKAAFEGTRGFDKRFVHFDVFFWLQLMLKWDFVFVNRILTVNRIHGAQVAVAVRNSLRSVFDHVDFWPEFLQEAAPLALPLGTKLRLRLKAPSQGATYIAIQLLKGRLGSAFAIARQFPLRWWAILPPLVARAFVRERARIRELAANNPLSVIYPD